MKESEEDCVRDGKIGYSFAFRIPIDSVEFEIAIVLFSPPTSVA